MLGPKRFEIIQRITREVVNKLKSATLIPHLITRLQALDSEIALLLETPIRSGETGKGKGKAAETKYSSSEDAIKLERLILAREKRLEMLERRKTMVRGNTSTAGIIAQGVEKVLEPQDDEEVMRQQEEAQRNEDLEAESAFGQEEFDVEGFS